MARSAIQLRNWRGVLVPVDDYARETLDKLPQGAEYYARLSRITRAGREEREGTRGKWWAGLDLLANQQHEAGYLTQRGCHDSILTALGFTRKRHLTGGRFELIPVSTKEGAMDDEEFDVLQELARAFCMAKFNYDPWEMWEQEQAAKKANEEAERRAGI